MGVGGFRGKAYFGHKFPLSIHHGTKAGGGRHGKLGRNADPLPRIKPVGSRRSSFPKIGADFSGGYHALPAALGVWPVGRGGGVDKLSLGLTDDFAGVQREDTWSLYVSR